jgi:putative DNA primase/helicase
MIPQSLTSRPQWVLWKMGIRHGELTKVPYQVNGWKAKSDTPSTWNTFAVVKRFERGGFRRLQRRVGGLT